MSRDQNVGQSHNIKTDNSSFERLQQFKYLGTTLTDQNSIQEEIKCRLKSGNAWLHSVQNLTSSSMLSKNITIKIHRSIILSVFCMGVKHGRSLWGRNVGWGCLRTIFGPKRDEETGEWRILHNEELNDLYSSPNIIRKIKSRRMRWAGHVARTGKRRSLYRVLVGKPEGKRPLGRSRCRWEDIIKIDLQEVG